MKILIVVDVMDWAIGHLAKSVAKFNTRHNIKIVSVHPRDAGELAVQENFLKIVEGFRPDLIDFEYFRTASQLVEQIPELAKYKKVVTHHNMRTKALYASKWQEPPLSFDRVLAHCTKTKNLLEQNNNAKDVRVIRYGFNFDEWSYCETQPKEKSIGYAGRVVKWKGLKELAQVATELNISIEMMGKLDSAEYWNEIEKDILRFNFMNCSDSERSDFYNNITIFVNNSVDGYEEGPMPLMEAMACGVPVITTPTGQACPEEEIFENGINCLIVPCGDNESLKNAITVLMEDDAMRDRIRKTGWETVRTMTEEKMAMAFAKEWQEVIFPSSKLVSVILPTTYSRDPQLQKILFELNGQTYKNFELIVVYDEQEERPLIDKSNFSFPIQEVWTKADKNKMPYNLAMARNLGAIEARGEYLVFCDSRLSMDKEAIEVFVDALGNSLKKAWFHGNKSNSKTTFVENFSAIKRSDFINMGMCNERIDCYGGMTQELRSRFKLQGGETVFLENARCQEILSSKTTPKKRKDIIRSKNLLFKMYGSQKL